MLRISHCILSLSIACVAVRTSEPADPRQWPVELQVGRFQIHADFDVSPQAALFPELTALSNDVGDILDIAAGDQPVHIVLFETAGEYQRYMRTYFPDLPERRALFIQDRGPGMLFAHWHVDVVTDLRHEITHALLNDSSNPLPLWLDEGLAEYFEVESPRRFSNNAYLNQVLARTAEGLVPSLNQLEGISELHHFKDAHYRDSWSWVHFFIHRSADTRQLLVRYLKDHRSGVQHLSLARQLHQITADANSEYQAHFLALQSSLNQSPVVHGGEFE